MKKMTLEEMKQIRETKAPFINQRVPKRGNTFSISYDEESRKKGAKEILETLINDQYENPTDVSITKAELPRGEYVTPVAIIIDHKHDEYIYENIDLEKAKKIYLEHGIKNKVVKELLKEKVHIEDIK